jgi:hypothetical protein
VSRETITVGILALSREPASRWARRGFVPSGVLPAAPATPPGTRLGPEGAVETWYAGPAGIALHPGDTGHYRDNLRSGRPAVWVALRGGGLEVAGATVDPYEGEGWAGDPGLVVEALAMPAPVAARVAAFFAAHHVEDTFVKRKRRRPDAEAMGRAAPRVLDLRPAGDRERDREDER